MTKVDERAFVPEIDGDASIQICSDLGTQVVAEQSGPTTSGYAGVFEALGGRSLIDDDLAERMVEAVRRRNLLVHLDLDMDDRKVFETLSHLDDLRRFAAFVEEQLD